MGKYVHCFRAWNMGTIYRNIVWYTRGLKQYTKYELEIPTEFYLISSHKSFEFVDKVLRKHSPRLTPTTFQPVPMFFRNKHLWSQEPTVALEKKWPLKLQSEVGY